MAVGCSRPKWKMDNSCTSSSFVNGKYAYTEIRRQYHQSRAVFNCPLDPFSTGKLEVGYIRAAHSISLFMLNRLIPIMTIKSEFLAPASRSQVPRASIGAKSRKNAIFLNQRGELLIYFTWNWLHVAEKNDSGGRKCLPPYSWADLAEKMCFFKPEVGKYAICDVKFAKTAKIWLNWDQWL